MRFNILTAIILTFLFGVFSTTQAQTTQQLKMQVGAQKKAFKNKITVQFIEVVEDSRCPEDVNCVWAGNAKVKIKVRKGSGAWKTLEVNSGNAPQTVEFQGYEIKMTNLTPTPRSNIRINRNGYVATFALRKM
jgi:FlaG/FlaF family flagellin (archaellin)